MPPIPATPVDDAEDLIRSVPASSQHYSTDPAGKLQLSSTAFNDRDRKPSVDRQKLLKALADAKKQPNAGLVKVIASEARAIKSVMIVDGRGKPTPKCHEIDVVHCPIDEDKAKGIGANPAHSQIESAPPATGGRFDKLKEALARIASSHGWIEKPGP